MQAKAAIAPANQPARIELDDNSFGEKEIVAAAVLHLEIGDVNHALADVKRAMGDVQIALLQKEAQGHRGQRRTRPGEHQAQTNRKQQRNDEDACDDRDPSEEAHCS